jgi:UPF0042 nucleotide-binding protein
MRSIPITIITGLSGSGKTTVMKVMEDLGYFCLDNLPIVLLPKFMELRLSSSSEIHKIAAVIDIRGKEFLEEAPRMIEHLKRDGYTIQILFLECEDEILLRRFSETRRSHPLAKDRPLAEGIREERRFLEPLKRMADWVIDTSQYHVHQLREVIEKTFSTTTPPHRMRIFLQSFGFRHGVPANTDILMDVRFLPNPYFVESLRSRTGMDPEVASYVLERDETREFLRRFLEFIDWLLPLYEKEGKTYLNLSIGCTGGHHRSVAVVNRMKPFFEERDYPVSVHHRDLHRE